MLDFIVDSLVLCPHPVPLRIPRLVEAEVFVVQVLRVSLQPPLVAVLCDIAVTISSLIEVVSLYPLIVLPLCCVHSCLAYFVLLFVHLPIWVVLM